MPRCLILDSNISQRNHVHPPPIPPHPRFLTPQSSQNKKKKIKMKRRGERKQTHSQRRKKRRKKTPRYEKSYMRGNAAGTRHVQRAIVVVSFTPAETAECYLLHPAATQTRPGRRPCAAPPAARWSARTASPATPAMTFREMLNGHLLEYFFLKVKEKSTHIEWPNSAPRQPSRAPFRPAGG